MLRSLVLVLFLLASCGDDSAEGCVTRADCLDGQVCINGACSLDATDASDEDGTVSDAETPDAERLDADTPDADTPDSDTPDTADSGPDDCRMSPCDAGFTCDEATGSCVPACFADEDCMSGVCRDAVCVAGCTDPSDCTAPEAAACDPATAMCAPCTADTECTGLLEGSASVSAPVCDTGLCVECTEASTTPCDGRSCDPATNRCTATPLTSLRWCEACVSDDECMDGRCVEMNFMGDVHGTYCLHDEGDGGCDRGFRTRLNAVSVSGVPGTYCGINEFTTCEALVSIGDPCDSDRDCEPGGLCSRGFGPDFCTIPCDGSRDCPDESTSGCDMDLCRPR